MKSDDKKIAQDNTAAFADVLVIIERAHENAFRAMNRELILMYWEIGHYISQKVSIDHWESLFFRSFHGLFNPTMWG